MLVTNIATLDKGHQHACSLPCYGGSHGPRLLPTKTAAVVSYCQLPSRSRLHACPRLAFRSARRCHCRPTPAEAALLPRQVNTRNRHGGTRSQTRPQSLILAARRRHLQQNAKAPFHGGNLEVHERGSERARDQRAGSLTTAIKKAGFRR